MPNTGVNSLQVRACFESLSKFLWLTALTPLNLEAHRPQNIPKRSFRYRHCCASDQRFHDHLVLRVPEQNVHSIGPAEPSRQQPVQVNTLRIQAKALHSITIFTRGCRTLRCRWHLMSGALTFFRCCFMDSCQVLHASCGGHNALILKPTQHETCRLNPGQQHPTSASADCRDVGSTTASRISHVARHLSHVIRHTPHVTRHTSHVTRHTS